MSTAAITFEPWYIDYHRIMGTVASVGQAIRRGTSVVPLAVNLWSGVRLFRDLLSDLEAIVELPKEGDFDLGSRLLELHCAMDRVLDLAQKRGYTNRTLTAGALHSLRICNEDLLDFVERTRLSRDPNFGRALSQATEEYDRGETVNIDTLI